MVGKKAKILSDAQVDRLLLFTSTTRNPIRNHVLVLLSLKAGLRAGEIAKLIFYSCGVAMWVKCLIFQESRAGFHQM